MSQSIRKAPRRTGSRLRASTHVPSTFWQMIDSDTLLLVAEHLKTQWVFTLSLTNKFCHRVLHDLCLRVSPASFCSSSKLLEFAFTCGLRPYHKMSLDICKRGDLQTLQIAKTKGCKLHLQTIDVASKYGKLKFVDHLVEKEGVVPSTTHLAKAAENGHLCLVIYFHRLQCQLTDDVATRVARNKYWHVLIWLLRQRCPTNVETARLVALNGQWRILKTMINKHSLPTNHHVISAAAAASGCKTTLKWTYDSHLAWDWSVCYAAAEAGHVNLLEFAREKRCEWNAACMVVAAQNGHLDVLRYGHTHG